MASSYDTSLFEGRGSSLVLSQRFKHMSYQFYGTLKATLQLLTAKGIMQYLPRPLAYPLLVFYLFLTTALWLLVAKQLCSERKQQQYKDFDLVDVARSRQKVEERLGSTFLFQAAYTVVNFVFSFCVINEHLPNEFLFVQIMLNLFLLISSLRDDQKK